VEFPGRQSLMLVDCGSESDAGFAVKPFLAAQGVNRLPCLLLTDGDLRHVGGTALITNDFSVTSDAGTATLRLRPARWEIRTMDGQTFAGDASPGAALQP